MEGNGNEQDDELGPDGHAERHADEDAVEEDPDFEEYALQHVLAQLLLGREVGCDAGVGVGVCALRFCVELPGVLGGLLVCTEDEVRFVVTGSLTLNPGQAPPDAGCPAAERTHVSHRDRRGLRLSLSFSLAAAVGKLRACYSTSTFLAPLPAHNANASAGMKHHLDNNNQKNARQRNSARHSGIVNRPEARQAGIAEQNESGGQEVDEGSGDEDAGAEVADGEEEALRELQAGEAGGEQGERAGEGGDGEDDEEGADVEGRVVEGFVDAVAGGAG